MKCPALSVGLLLGFTLPSLHKRLKPSFSPALCPRRSHLSFLLKMNSVAVRLAKYLRVSALTSSSHAVGVQRGGWLWYSTRPSQRDDDEVKNGGMDEEIDDFLGSKPELQLQSVDPKRGWGFRGVHKAIICGKVGQSPVQKILRNGKNVTIFTVGTGGMFDQRIVGEKDLPKPVQWHRIAVHNEVLGAYAVQQLVKNFNAALQFMLRAKLRLEFTMIASMVKLKASQRYVFAMMGEFAL